MAKVKIEGVEVEIAGDEISQEEFEFLTDLKKEYKSKLNPSGVSDEDINPETGYYNLPEVDSKIRFAVSAAPNFKSKVQTLQKFFPKVTQDEYDPTNFILEDANGKKFILDDKSKTTFGDVIDEGKGITQAVTSTAGAIVGTVGGPGGTIVGSGVGLAAGSEIYERMGQLAGAEIDRDLKEYATTRGMEFALGAVAQTAGPLLLRGTKYIFKGSEKSIYDKAATKLGVKDGKAAYNKLTLEQKINSNLQLNMADRLKLFNKYKTKPTLGQASENPIIDTLETTFANVPFAAQILRTAAEESQDQLGKVFTKNVVDSLQVPRLATTGEAAGVIKRGLIGKGGKVIDMGDLEFGITNSTGSIQRFRNINNVNYGAVRELLSVTPEAQKQISMKKTLQFLSDEAKAPGGLERTFASINDPKIRKMFDSLSKDSKAQFNKKSGELIGGGTIGYDGVDAIRKAIGQKLSDPILFERLPRSVYKKLYSNITDDIQVSLKSIGGKQGAEILKAVQKANNYYNNQIKIIDKFVEPLAKKADIDNIVNQLINKSKVGDTTLRTLMNEIGADRSAVLISSIMNKMGQVPSTGQLGALGRNNLFNTQQFIKNFDELSDEAKKTLFQNPMFKGKSYATLNQSLKDVNALATYIERQNPFKDLGQTATKGAAGTGLLIGGGATVAIGTGDPLFLLGIPIFGYGGAFALRVMSNPAFMQWVSQGVKIAGNKGFDGVLEHITKLGTIAGMSDEDTADLTNQYLEIMKQVSQAKEQEEKEQQISQQNQQTQETLRQTVSRGAPAQPSAPTPVNTQVTDPQQYSALFPQDTLGQAIAQQKII
jgi:hypothetical protein